MELRFDANQDFQIRAIEVVCDLFEGEIQTTDSFGFQGKGYLFATIQNTLSLTEDQLFTNLTRIQNQNNIRPDSDLKIIEGIAETADGEQHVRFPNFSVEMETGTGKTYVYLRTIIELNKRYGMRKFIIVVPSVAIREGVLKTCKITKKHLGELFGNPVYSYYSYDSSNLTQIRQFALSESIEIMVMTLDSFNKASNIIRTATDRLQGETPIHLVQGTNPILILDEPQNMESEKAVIALTSLNPLFALRYSATHKNPYNLVYRLTPAEAYNQGLVKKIEVASVMRQQDENKPYIRLDEIQTGRRAVSAKIAVHKLNSSGQVKETVISVKPGDILLEKTNRSEYASFDVDEINPGGQFIRFSNNIELQIGEEQGVDRDALFAAQIKYTIKEHMEKQKRLRSKGIKVLSLFFIDKVANYAEDNGIIKTLFDQYFNEIKNNYPDWKDISAEHVRTAYFAEKRKRGGEVEMLDSSSGEAEQDIAAYDLIMRDKESLLSFPSELDDETEKRRKQVSFIFSHSALREGWDNPNIFQICTLNQTVSLIKKRQEVGRGIRLSVDQSGQRIRDDGINFLTVVANESYQKYVEEYQSEIASEYQSEIEIRYGKKIGDLGAEERRKVEEEYGSGVLPPAPRKAGERKSTLRKARVLSEDFKELWDRIKHKTQYHVRIDTEEILTRIIPKIDLIEVQPPRITVTKAQIIIEKGKNFSASQLSAERTLAEISSLFSIPNLVDQMADLLDHTTPPVRLTRRTLLEIFKRIKNQDAAGKNPQEWVSHAARIIKDELADLLVNGIEYTRVIDIHGGIELPDSVKWYQMSQILDEEEIELFSKFIVDTKEEKSVYNRIPCDSEIESQFVNDLDARQDVRLFLKLPYWFSVPTPVGEYRPDWAVVMDNPEEEGKPVLYLVTETKGSTREGELRPNEHRKIVCGAAHFGSRQFKKKGALKDIDYKVVIKAGELP